MTPILRAIGGTPKSRLILFLAAAALIVLAGILFATSMAWVTDDAFISFRYARNLVRGLGLVFNPGERVEGYTNFLWTLIIAAGMKAGLDPVPLATTLGVIFSSLTLVLAFVLSWKFGAGRTKAGIVVPFAALALCVHREFAVFSTGGLETSMFTFLVSLGFVLLVLGRSAVSLSAAGIVFALTLMTRPDGSVFLLAATIFLLIRRENRGRSVVLFLLPVALLYAPYWIWRYSYYGYAFPNPYYAKSIGLSYYSAGIAYVGTYFKTYYAIPLVLAGVVAVLWRKAGRSIAPRRLLAAIRGPGSPPPEAGTVILGLLYAALWLLFIVRIGGDFMFGRFLVPLTPVLFFLIEALLVQLPSRGMMLVLGTALAAGIFFRYDLFDGVNSVGLVADEWQHYPAKIVAENRRHGELMNKYFREVPVTVAFGGMQAQLIYYADPAVAIECETGLTDTTIAHMPIAARRRPGHEKHAPIDYLTRRRVNLLFWGGEKNTPGRFISNMTFDTIAVPVPILVYENPVMDRLSSFPELKFFNVPEGIDRYLESIGSVPPDRVRKDYGLLKKYYFDVNSDSARERGFVEYLKGSAPAVPR